jgi:ribosomal protein S18 acetylase RimI-like enzyme
VHADRQLAVALRAARLTDRELIEEIHLAALGPIALVGYGWPKERLRRQFHAEVDLATCHLLVVDGRAAGYISILDRGGWWYIDAFAILPKFQRRGVGSTALRHVLDAAGAKPVRLSVLHTNRARGLYLRHGFAEVGRDPLRAVLEWRPG